jgi:hypothetical protein
LWSDFISGSTALKIDTKVRYTDVSVRESRPRDLTGNLSEYAAVIINKFIADLWNITPNLKNPPGGTKQPGFTVMG